MASRFQHITSKILFAALYISVGNAVAEVVLDNSLTNTPALPGPDFQITADHGVQQGANLFHSFQSFSLTSDQSATFSGPNSVANIIGRVTGGATSNIDGTINSTIPDANLFFINPAGVMFGPNAEINIDGSFYVSTADNLSFADGTRLATGNANAPILTSASPAAFGFLGNNADVSLQGTTTELADGARFVVAAGNINIDDVTIQIRDGAFDLAAVESEGEVSIYDTGIALKNVEEQGDVILTSALAFAPFIANLDVSGQSGGAVNIIADTILLDRAFIYADTNGAGTGAGVSLRANNVQLVNGSRITTDNFGTGDAGNILVNADSVGISGSGATIGSRAAAGTNGDISFNTGELLLSDEAVIEYQVGRSASFGVFTINTDSLIINTDAGIATSSSSNITTSEVNVVINASASIQLISGAFLFSGAAAANSAAASNLVINSPLISIQNQSSIATNSNSSSGMAGDITLNADTVILDGMSSITSTASLFPGDIKLNVSDALLLREQSSIQSSAIIGTQNAADITISSPVFVSLLDQSLIQGNADAGRGGNITITTENLFQDAASRIEATTLNGDGIDGTVEVNSPEDGSRTGLDSLAKDFSGITVSLKQPCNKHTRVSRSSFVLATPKIQMGPSGYQSSVFISKIINKNRLVLNNEREKSAELVLMQNPSGDCG